MTDYSNSQESGDIEQIDIKAILFKYLQHWRWFVLTLLLCLVAAFLYLRYATPTYSVSAKVLIKDDKKGGGMDAAAAFSDLNIFQSHQNINNEIEILKGKGLMSRVMQELNLHTTYYTHGRVIETELYGKNNPIKVVITEVDSAAAGKRIQIELIDAQSFILRDSEGEKTYKFSTPIKKPYGTFSVIANTSNLKKGYLIDVQYNNIEALGNAYNSHIQIAPSSKDASVLNISLVDASPEKAKSIINKVIEVYDREAIDDKNQIARNTVKFIDERLSALVGDLEAVEKNVESFKRQNQVSDVGMDAQALIQGSAEYNRKSVEIQTQISVVESLQNYMRSASTHDLIPGIMGVQDPTLNQLAKEYNELQLERKRLLERVQAANPAIVSLDEQLRSLKGNITQSLGNIKRSLEINRNALNREAGGFQSSRSNIPTIERNLLEIGRAHV